MPEQNEQQLPLLAGLLGGVGGAAAGSSLSKDLLRGEGDILKRLETAPRGRLGLHQIIPLPLVGSAQTGRLARESGKLRGGDIKGTIAGMFAPSYLTERSLLGRKGIGKIKGAPGLGGVLDALGFVAPGGGLAGRTHRGLRQAQVLQALGEKNPKLKGALSFLGVPWGTNALRRGLAKKELDALSRKRGLAKGLKYGLPVGAAALAAGLASVLSDKDKGKKEAALLENKVRAYGAGLAVLKLSE